MGYGGYEGLLSNNAQKPEINIPIVTISITFAIFMVLVLITYLYLLRKE
jgi:hypothetical protein